ncbi:MAG: STAS domain-containing protein [Acidimicrobiales bacterium]
MLSVRGDLDLATRQSLAPAVEVLLKRGGTFIDIDLSNVIFIDCAGWRGVEQLQDALAAKNVRCKVINVSPPVRRFLDLLSSAATIGR